MEEKRNKLRVLHSAALLRPPSGICTQMDWEQEAAETLGIDWKVKMFCPAGSKGGFKVMHFDPLLDAAKLKSAAGKLLAWVQLRQHYHDWLLSQQGDVDVFLLRYYVHDPFQLAFVKRCKKPVYFVHHTLEVPELALPGGVSGWVRATLETLIGKPTIAKATGTVGVTQEIADYELARAGVPDKPQYVYPNGIVFKEQELLDRRSADVPEFLFVANFAPWHGLDRLLASVAQSKEQFVLHLVGKVPESLLSRTRDPRIQVHGTLNHEQIAMLSQQCWVGLASFALDRNKMKQACPLKVREYLMLGLPVYGDYEDVFSADVEYFRCGGNSISEIVDFCQSVRRLMKNEISSLARAAIDKTDLVGALHDRLVFANPLNLAK